MTTEEILKLAREAGLENCNTHICVDWIAVQLIKFAELICAANASRWQPIETAPAEGQFLAYMPTDEIQPMQVAKWHPNVKVVGGHFTFDMEPITHWMPLPEFKEES